MQPNPGVSTERTGEGVTYSLGVRGRKGGLCKWTAGKTQPPSSRASSCEPQLPAWMMVVRAERKAGRPSPCPWVWRPEGRGQEQEGAGCGPGPWREREREEAGLSVLPVVRAFCSNCPSYDEQSKVQGSHVPTVTASAAGGGGQTLPGAQGSPPPQAAFSSLCLESAQGESVTDTGPLFTAAPLQHRLGPSPTKDT